MNKEQPRDYRALTRKAVIISCALHAVIAIPVPLLELLSLRFFLFRITTWLSTGFGVLILAAVALSLLFPHRFLSVLNLFAGVLFINAFVQSAFPSGFIALVFVAYAVLALIFLKIALGSQAPQR